MGKSVPKITYEDVLEWVEAGPEGGGKDKTQVEQVRRQKDGRVDEHIAMNVLEAIEQYRLGSPVSKDYSGITERLERWVERWVESRVLAGDFGVLLLAVLDAWAVVVLALAERDLALWADEAIQDSFR